MDITRFLYVLILSLFSQDNVSRIVFLQTRLQPEIFLLLYFSVYRLQSCCLPEIVAVVDCRFDVIITGIGNQQRFSCRNIISVVVRNILKSVSVGKDHIHTVAIGKAEVIEFVDADFNIDSAELRFVLCGIIPDFR